MTTNVAAPSVRSLCSRLVPAETRGTFRFVWLGNFEAERFWSQPGTVELPKISAPAQTAIVNRLEEMSLLLAESPDVVILREPSDPAYLDYLRELGFTLPTIITVSPSNKTRTISQAILDDEAFCHRLRILVETSPEPLLLLPFGKTRLEEQLAEATGLRTLGPSAPVCEYVNSKVYSRRVTQAAGLQSIPGFECESFAQLDEALSEVSAGIGRGKRYLLKESMGVSGKGLFLIAHEGQVAQVRKLLQRKARPDSPVAFVIEQFLDKSKDINYQLVISDTGDVQLLSIKEAVTDNGVHVGHRFPPELSDAQMACYEEATQAIGRQLFADGFTGIAGIDSLIDTDGIVYPVLEINARFNMSTYHLGVERLAADGAKAIAKLYPLSLRQPITFDALRAAIGRDLLTRPGDGYGAVIENFATVNVNVDDARAPESGAVPGRLYTLLIARSYEEARALDERIAARLNSLM